MKADVIIIISSMTAVLGLVTAIMAARAQGKAAKAMEITEGTHREVQTISVNVDGQLSRLFEREDRLVRVLAAAGVTIPPLQETGESNAV